MMKSNPVRLHSKAETSNRTAVNRHSKQHQRVKNLLTMSSLCSSTTNLVNTDNQLPVQTRLNMEALFKHDLSNIKIKNNSTKAVELGANAYTQGTQIHFAPGLYNPHTQKGKRLIAHELAHVVQQNRNQVKPTSLFRGTPVNDHSQLEREADQMGQRASRMEYSKTLNFDWYNNLNKQKIQAFSGSTQAIQKEDNKTGFDIDYSLLPPSLQLRLWILSLDANTSRVRLSHDFGNIAAGLNFNYPKGISADISARGFKGSFGVNFIDNFGFDQSNVNLSLGGSYRGFNASATGNFGQRSFGLNLGYGSRLLPFPSQLSSIFNSGAQGFGNVVGDISSAPNNPLAWYGLHSDDISTITTAIKTGKQIHDQQTSSQRFGAGLRLSYSPLTGFMIYTGVQLNF
jgi:hypothetical protein